MSGRPTRVRVLWSHPKLMDYRLPLFESVAAEHQVEFFFFGESEIANTLTATFASGRSFMWPDVHEIRLLASRIRECDVFVTSFLWNGFSIVGIVIARLFGKRVIVWEERWFWSRTFKHSARRVLMRVLVRLTNVFYVFGDLQREFLLRLGAANDQIFVANEYPAHRYSEVPDKPVKLPVQAGARTVLFIGRLVDVKGVEYLVAAFDRVWRTEPMATLLIVGDGPLKSDLERQVMALGTKNVHFMGWVSEPGEKAFLYRAASVVVVPSVILADGDAYEGGPLVVLEALSAGRPVVGSNALGSSTSFIHDDINGFVVPEKNVEALAGRILDVLNDLPRFSRGAVATFASIKGFDYQAHVFGQLLDATTKRTNGRGV